MPIERRSLTVYHIRQSIDGERVTSFDQILRDPASVQTLEPTVDGLDFDTRLYISIIEAKDPPWLSLLAEAFDDLEIPASQRSDAILAVRVSYYRRDHIFAFAFGQGRHLLKPGSYDRSYGLRVALNIIYDSEDRSLQPDRLRSVDSTTVATNTIRTRRQVDRRADFETFGVDIQRDLLKAVTGAPVVSETWGTRISGSDSFHANPALEFTRLGKYCIEIARSYRRETYKLDFDWIDNLSVVTDPNLLSALHTELVARITAASGYTVSVPELVDWDQIATFRFSFLPTAEFTDPEDANVFGLLQDAKKADDLTIDSLKKRWRLEALATSGDQSHSWPLFTCLSAELTLSDNAFILSEGEFFQVRKEFLDDLDAFIAALPRTAHVLPDSVGDLDEGDYNEAAANSQDRYLLLDKRTVRVGGITSPVEVCDVLTDDGTFIHVKRKLGSSSLSHLFAQGTVSADLFLMSKDYRVATLEAIQAQEVARSQATGAPGFVGRFSTFDVDGIRSSEYAVTYGIVANWGDRALEEALPFFSKVNLRRHVGDLHRMGYRVEMAMIKVT